MISPAFSDPQIEVLAGGARLPAVLSALAGAGLRPIRAQMPVEPRTSLPLLIDLASVPADPPPAGLAPVLGTAGRPIVYLGRGRAPDQPGGASIHIANDSQLAGLPARLALRRRARLRESETRMRQETAQQFGTPLYVHRRPDTPPSALFFGTISPRLLPLSRGLTARGVELVCSMSLMTTRKHLESRSFNLVIVDVATLDSAPQDIHALSEVHANTPFLVLETSSPPITLDGFISLDGDIEVAIDLIAERARTTPLRTWLDDVRLGATSHDPLTGLYSEAFLGAHLPRQMQACQSDQTPLSLLHLRLRPTGSEADTRKVLTRFARQVASSLRETDLVARTGPANLLCSLRDTGFAGATQLAQRLAGEHDRACRLQRADATELMWRVVERRDSHTTNSLIDAALSGPFSRAIAA